MPERLVVQGPAPIEEIRALAEELSDLHYGISLIVEHASELVPGESVDELRHAWEESRMSLIQLVRSLDPKAKLLHPPFIGPFSVPPTRTLPRAPARISHKVLAKHELTGAPGRAKRSLLRRLKDRFFGAWNEAPRTPDQTARAAEVAYDWLEAGETVVGSIPGAGTVEEIVSLVKQYVGFRWRRRS